MLRRRMTRFLRGRPHRLRGYRSPRARVLVRLGGHQLVYGGRWPFAALAAALTAATVITGTLVGRPLIALSALAVVALWLLYALRIQPLVMAGGGGRNRPGPGPGAGVREPRRPLPKSPAGAAEHPLSAP